MPVGEEMFKYHGYSGPCPKPPLPKSPRPAWHDLHNAWLRYTRASIVTCDSDAEGAFKVYKANVVEEQRQQARDSRDAEVATLKAEKERAEAACAEMRDFIESINSDYSIDEVYEVFVNWEIRKKILDAPNPGASLLAELEGLRKSEQRLREALQAVELVNSGNWRFICPWCRQEKKEGHAPDCKRQAALGGKS